MAGQAQQPATFHWPEYLIEAACLGLFMVSAGAVTTLLEWHGSLLHDLLPNADLRRALIGGAMGLTAIALIHSPWGRRSGAHMNPAVTLAFLSLGRIARRDAVAYILMQVAGGWLGLMLARVLLGSALASPEVHWVATVPGPSGALDAWVAECAMAFLLLLVVLEAAARPATAPHTGAIAGALVALYITVEAPVSGMSINPARTLASAIPAHEWSTLWIYFTAPVAGALVAALVHARLGAGRGCAKLDHSGPERCIHCGWQAS